MKWSIFVVFLINLLPLTSCSDAPAKKEADGNVTNAEVSTAPAIEAKEKKTDAFVQGLKGKVEVLSETVYRAGPSKKMMSKNVFKYDDNGNRRELVSYRPDGKIRSTVKSTYDANGNITREETMLSDGTVEVTSEIKTDGKGNRIEQQDTRRGSGSPTFNYKHSFKYDEKGQLIERTTLTGSGHLSFRYNFSYDANGNRVEWIQTGPDSTVVGKVLYKYDGKNNLIEESMYGKNNNLTNTYTYTYEFDKNGNWRRQNKLENGELIEIKERNIDYD